MSVSETEILFLCDSALPEGLKAERQSINVSKFWKGGGMAKCVLKCYYYNENTKPLMGVSVVLIDARLPDLLVFLSLSAGLVITMRFLPPLQLIKIMSLLCLVQAGSQGL